jgi:hypothetical protein
MHAGWGWGVTATLLHSGCVEGLCSGVQNDEYRVMYRL